MNCFMICLFGILSLKIEKQKRYVFLKKHISFFISIILILQFSMIDYLLLIYIFINGFDFRIPFSFFAIPI